MTDTPAPSPPADAPASGPTDTPAPSPSADAATARRPYLALALGLLVVVVVLEVLASPALTPGRSGSRPAQVLAIPGVSRLVDGAQIDPTEAAQVARRPPPAPLAFPALGVLDGLVLVVGAAAWSQRRSGPAARPRPSRVAWLTGGLALVLLGLGLAVGAAAIGRLHFLVALYLSPPYGTLSYLLVSGSSRRGDCLLALSALMALKVGAVASLLVAVPDRARPRGMAGLALSATAATVLVTFGYGLAPGTLTAAVDALVAAIVAVVAVLWAAVVLSAAVRRVA